MSRKIKFTAISVSSEDEKHRLAELNSHGPTVKGWQSEKNCSYPQEVVLQLETKSKLQKIQILAHQYLISEKLELWYSAGEGEAQKWDYLGYVTLSDNQSTGFKSRELKSVNVPSCVARYVKIRLAKNHTNAYNINNQVSLIAINVLGCDAQSTGDDADAQFASPYDDLAFLMYVDTEVAEIIKQMERKKLDAVKNERFEYARKLKNAMENLRQAGERLSKYELEKRHAIEVEDYERARHKKTLLEDYRAQVYAQLDVEQLLEAGGANPKNDECADAGEDKQGIGSPQARAASAAAPVSPPHRPKSPGVVNDSESPPNNTATTGNGHQRTGSFRRRNKSAGAIVKSSYEAYEERTLPALRQECHIESEIKTVSKLTDREKKQAALPILVFGTDLVEKFYSKQYSDKEDGLHRLRDHLRLYDGSGLHTANKTARAAIFLLHRALRDKVYSVYSLANEVIRLFFVEFVPARVSQAEVARSVDRLLPELLTKSGDQAARIHHMAVHTILTMADCPSVRELHQIPVHLSRPVSSSTHPRLALSRMEMVEQLIINIGISTDKQSGLTCRTLSEFGVSGLHHPAEAVRKVAERVLVQVYKVNPRLVRKQLPPDDDITRRNLLYRQLFHEFDKIDVQRKQSILERNRLIQQFSMASNHDCTSPEPVNNIQSSNSPKGPRKIDHDDAKLNAEHTSSSSASGISSPSSTCPQDNEEGGKSCIFCGARNAGSTDATLNVHYWKWCPMLTKCSECSQIVEVATLNEHLLNECEKREKYNQCACCSDAIVQMDYERHIKQCQELHEGCVKCPLCREQIEENLWREHLMGDFPCSKNPRAKIHQKQVTIKT